MQAMLARWQEWDMVKLSFTYYGTLADECAPNCECRLGKGGAWCTVGPYCDTLLGTWSQGPPLGIAR